MRVIQIQIPGWKQLGKIEKVLLLNPQRQNISRAL